MASSSPSSPTFSSSEDVGAANTVALKACGSKWQMQPLSKFQEVPCTNSKYIHTTSLLYERQGHKCRWDVLLSMDAVGGLVYHRERDALVLVRQFRAPMYLSDTRRAATEEGVAPPKPEDAVCWEVCAGLVDKRGKSLAEVFAEEVEEECGFRVAAADVEWVNNARNSVGKAGNRHCYFYVEVSDSQRVSSGGGIPGEEDIDVVYVPVAEAEDAVLNNKHLAKTPSLMYLMQWFFATKRTPQCAPPADAPWYKDTRVLTSLSLGAIVGAAAAVAALAMTNQK